MAGEYRAMDDAIEALLAREAIRRQLHNYGRGLDRMDEALVRDVWHADGTADYAMPGVRTIDELIRALWDIHATWDTILHRLMQMTIEVAGDRAVSESYVIACLYRKAGKGRMTETFANARYLDRWSKRDGRWAIDHRRAVMDLGGTREIEAQFMGRQARLDRSDPSYVLFDAFAAGE